MSHALFVENTSTTSLSAKLLGVEGKCSLCSGDACSSVRGNGSSGSKGRYVCRCRRTESDVGVVDIEDWTDGKLDCRVLLSASDASDGI